MEAQDGNASNSYIWSGVFYHRTLCRVITEVNKMSDKVVIVGGMVLSYFLGIAVGLSFLLIK